MTPTIIQALIPLLVIVATPIITRLFRKLGLDITEAELEPILIRIIEIIAKVEEDSPAGEGGEAKKQRALNMAIRVLSPKEQQMLIKKYGSMETAIQAAFEQSSVSLK